MSAAENIDRPTPTLRGVRADEIIELWDRIMPIMTAAASRSGGKYAAGDLMKAVALRDMQLWLALDGEDIAALAVTEIVNFPQRRVCRVLIVTGEDHERWIGYSDALAHWAKEQGCKAIEALARPGWKRIMQDFGWRMTHVQMDLEL